MEQLVILKFLINVVIVNEQRSIRKIELDEGAAVTHSLLDEFGAFNPCFFPGTVFIVKATSEKNNLLQESCYQRMKRSFSDQLLK